MTSGVQPRLAGAVLASGLLITGCSRKPAPSTVNAAAPLGLTYHQLGYRSGITLAGTADEAMLIIPVDEELHHAELRCGSACSRPRGCRCRR